MNWFKKDKSHALIEVVIRQSEGYLNSVASILENSTQPFNLFFGAAADFSETFRPRGFDRYHTPFLLMLPSQVIIKNKHWLENILGSVDRAPYKPIRYFDEHGKEWADQNFPKIDWARIVLIDRRPVDPKVLETVRSDFNSTFPQPVLQKDKWVDLAIANVRPNNGLLWQTIESICNGTNYPFRIIVTCGLRSLSANRNMGLVNATSDYVCLFDDDLLVNDPNWLGMLLETLLHEPDIAVSGPKIVGKSGLIVRCGADDLARPIGAGEPSAAYTGVFEVHTMSSCMLMKRKVVPLFDLLFPGAIAFEDIDHAYRLRRKGWRVFCDARVELTHLRPSTRAPVWTWNHLYYHLKHPRTLIGLGRIKGDYIE